MNKGIKHNPEYKLFSFELNRAILEQISDKNPPCAHIVMALQQELLVWTQRLCELSEEENHE